MLSFVFKMGAKFLFFKLTVNGKKMPFRIYNITTFPKIFSLPTFHKVNAHIRKKKGNFISIFTTHRHFDEMPSILRQRKNIQQVLVCFSRLENNTIHINSCVKNTYFSYIESSISALVHIKDGQSYSDVTYS